MFYYFFPSWIINAGFYTVLFLGCWNGFFHHDAGYIIRFYKRNFIKFRNILNKRAQL